MIPKPIHLARSTSSRAVHFASAGLATLLIALAGGCGSDGAVDPHGATGPSLGDPSGGEPLAVPSGYKLSIVPMPARDLADWDEYRESYRLARSLGVSVAHGYVEWGAIERSRDLDRWDAAANLVALAGSQGMQVSMVITVINVLTLGSLPADLPEAGLADPELQERWLGFLARFSTRFADDIDYLWLGNEIDIYLDLHPEEVAAWADLLERSVEVVHLHAPRMTVGTVMTYHNAVGSGRVAWIHTFGPVVDRMGITYYPEMMPGGYEPGRIQEQIDALIRDYGAYPLALVETAVGAVPYNGGGESAQVEYCHEFFRALRRHPGRFAFAGWFNLYDFSPEYVDTLSRSWGIGDPELIAWFGSTALARFDGSPRPVLTAWAKGVVDLQDKSGAVGSTDAPDRGPSEARSGAGRATTRPE